jgi:ectoine hydroxylase-related dioxygenase (phytanoyl-CoA dioxygenase family)
MKIWIQKYSGWIRNLRLTYHLYNLANFKKLKKNKAFYKNLGINKAVWQSIAHADIKQGSKDIPWLDKSSITAAQIKLHPNFHQFNSNIQEQLLSWPEKGYLIIENFFSAEEVEAINNEINNLQKAHKIDFNFTGRKIMDAWKHSPLINNIFKHKTLLNIFSFIFQKPVIPFQTINFIYGSEQKPHSDSIHMTTEPLGYLAAVWIALEDIQPGSGELIYYPGSHKLKYILSEDYQTGNNKILIGEENYTNYEKAVQELIANSHLKPHYFHAKKGDILIWHANLLHGGSIITNPTLTRKSMVAHYYAEGVLCYHEISQRPAILPQ